MSKVYSPSIIEFWLTACVGYQTTYLILRNTLNSHLFTLNWLQVPLYISYQYYKNYPTLIKLKQIKMYTSYLFDRKII